MASTKRGATRLNDRLVRGLEATSDTGTFYYDSMVKGLAIRVYPSGRKSWLVRYTLNGRKRGYRLGDYPAVGVKDARSKAKSVLGKVEDGEDPQAERQEGRKGHTVRELLEEYLERRASEKRTAADYRRVLTNEIPGDWLSRKANEITAVDVQAVLDGIVDRGAPYTADKFRAFLSGMFRYGVPRGYVRLNVVKATELPHSPKPRESDPLSEELIRKLWTATADEEPVIRAFYRLRLLTLQRGRQVRLMRWADIDGPWWTAPGMATKNARPNRVYLSPLALRELERLRPLTGGGDWVLPSPRNAAEPLGSSQTASGRIREGGGLPADFARDFRRTGTTYLTGTEEVTSFDCDRVLGHKLPGVMQHYNLHDYADVKRKALTMWGERVTEILQPERGTVVSGAFGR